MKKSTALATLAAASLVLEERGNKTVPCVRDCLSRTLWVR